VAAVFIFAMQSRALPPLQGRTNRSVGDDVLLGAGVFAAAMPLIGATAFLSIKTTQALGYPVRSQEIAELFANADSPGLLIALTVFSVTLVPVNEEILFRAGVFRFVRAYTPLWVALPASGLFFATFHFSAVYFVPLTVLGMILAYSYEKTGSLVVPIVAHGLFNLNSIIGIITGQGDLP
jgi:membrane protease YdiL (CAAX protease family)